MPKKIEQKEVVIVPDRNAEAQATQLAQGIGALVEQGRGLYTQLIDGKGQLGFDPERLALLQQMASSETGSVDLARKMIHFRETLRALSSVTDIAGLPINEMQARVEVLAAVLRRNEVAAQQKPFSQVVTEGGRPRNLSDVVGTGEAIGRQLALRGEVSGLDRQIESSRFRPDSALEAVLALPEMEGIWHLAIMYAEAMHATKDEFDLLLGDLVKLEKRLEIKADASRSVHHNFERFEANRIRLSGEIAAAQAALASFDTRSMDSDVRRDRMATAAKQIDEMAERAKLHNEAFLAGVQSLLQMKSLAMGAMTDRENMETYLDGLKYLMTIYYMQAAGLAGCLTGAARITGAAMRQYLELETQRVMGRVGADLNLVETVVKEVTGELHDLMNAGTILANKQEEKRQIENETSQA